MLVLVLLVIVLLFRSLLLTSFDPVSGSIQPSGQGLSTFLMVLLTLVSVTAMQVSEPFSSSPCSLHPATTYLCSSLWSMMLLSSGSGVLHPSTSFFIGYSLNIAVRSYCPFCCSFSPASLSLLSRERISTLFHLIKGETHEKTAILALFVALLLVWPVAKRLFFWASGRIESDHHQFNPLQI